MGITYATHTAGFSSPTSSCFYVKFKKCEFGKQEIEYLGYIVTTNSVKVDNQKTQAMLKWTQPASVAKLCGFLGLTGYCRKFVRSYGLIARPRQFRWGENEEKLFEELMQTMTSTPTVYQIVQHLL